MKAANITLIVFYHLLCLSTKCIFTISGNEVSGNNFHKTFQKYNEVTISVLKKLHVNLFIGQVLLPTDPVGNSLDVAILGQMGIPLVTFGNRSSYSDERGKQLQSYRFGSSFYAHVDVEINSYGSPRLKSWRRMYSDLLSHRTPQKNGDPIRTFMERIFLHDVFLLYKQDNSPQSHIISVSKDAEQHLMPRNSIWIIQKDFRSRVKGKGKSYELGLKEKCEYGFSSNQIDTKIIKFSEFSEPRSNQYGDNHENENSLLRVENECERGHYEKTELSIACPTCLENDLFYIREKKVCRSGEREGHRSSVGCLLSEVSDKLNATFEISLKASGHSDMFLRSKNDNSVVKRSQSYMSPRVMFRSSLIFVASKNLRNWNSILKPFTIVSWIGILAAYSIAAIVFLVIKIVTLNNPDQSWYDYMVQQLLEIVDRNYNNGKATKLSAVNSDVEKGDLDEPNNNEQGTKNTDGNSVDNGIERGKTSKAFLHATIRMVSFVLVAAYEGKLYNTITFPKSRFISTFDELLTSDKYSVKISREAEQADLPYLRLQSSASHMNSSTGSVGLRSSRSVMVNNIVESVNIEDCINWVESNSNHACIGYEFEFRNLQKAQKFEKIFTKSKEKINRFGFGFNSVRGTRQAFPAMQISRWVLEAGIFQFWTLAENIFNDSVAPNRLSKSRVLTIKDYLGLFVVYVILILLSGLILCCECGFSAIARNFERVVDFWNFLKDQYYKCLKKSKILISRAKLLWMRFRNMNLSCNCNCKETHTKKFESA